MINNKSQKYFNQIFCIGGTPNAVWSHNKDDHRPLMEIYYQKNVRAGKVSEGGLIDYLKSLDVSKLNNFTMETSKGKKLPWNPVIESN